MKSANDIIAQARRMLTRRYNWNDGTPTWVAETPRQNRVLNIAGRYLRNINNATFGEDPDLPVSRSTYMGIPNAQAGVRSAGGSGK